MFQNLVLIYMFLYDFKKSLYFQKWFIIELFYSCNYIKNVLVDKYDKNSKFLIILTPSFSLKNI